MAKKVTLQDPSTEQKIKEAAKRIFIQKGYSAATTREIADEAGINRALLNYYFRSKEKLFNEITQDQAAVFFGGIYPIINDQTTSLEVKIKRMVIYYTDVLLAQPSLVMFVLNEMQNNPERLSVLMKENHGLNRAVIARQLQEVRNDIHPMHFLMSILGMILYPYIGSAVFQQSMDIDKKAFDKMMKERVNVLPALIKAMVIP